MSAEHEIRDAVRQYVEGMSRGDRALLQSVFHAKASVIGHFDGGLEWSDLGAFADACAAEAIPAEAATPAHEIEAVDIDGDAALVRVVNQWAGLRFRDWLSFLHHDGRWQIVAKLFRQIT